MTHCKFLSLLLVTMLMMGATAISAQESTSLLRKKMTETVKKYEAHPGTSGDQLHQEIQKEIAEGLSVKKQAIADFQTNPAYTPEKQKELENGYNSFFQAANEYIRADRKGDAAGALQGLKKCLQQI